MSDYYVMPHNCPKCQSNCWQKVGGYRGIPVDYSCVICGWMASRTDAAARQVTPEEVPNG